MLVEEVGRRSSLSRTENRRIISPSAYVLLISSGRKEDPESVSESV